MDDVDALTELYHVTFDGSLDSIGQGGLDPSVVGVWDDSSYGAHSRGRVFLTDEDGIQFWYNRFEEQSNARSDDPREDGAVPVVLRVRVPEDLLHEDPLGSRDSLAGAYYVLEPIGPSDIELWDGDGWVEPSDGVDPELALEWEDDSDVESGGYWMFNDSNPLAAPDTDFDWLDEGPE